MYSHPEQNPPSHRRLPRRRSASILIPAAALVGTLSMVLAGCTSPTASAPTATASPATKAAGALASATPAGAVLAAAAPAVTPAVAAATPRFDTPDPDFKGQVSVVDTPIVLPGSEVQLGGRNFKPGQQVRLSYGDAALGGDQPLTVGADGTFRTRFTVPADASAGRYPVVVKATNPSAALIHTLKVSPDIPLSGQDRFTLNAQKLVPGLYQAAYSPRTDRIFVTAAVGRPPVAESRLLKVNPATLATEASVTPPAVPAKPATGGEPARAPGVYAVYGVAVDDVTGTVWVTNTRQDSIAVYRQSDLALVKQFDVGAVEHARDVIVDEKLGRAYVSATGSNHIVVFDTKSLKRMRNIEIESSLRGFNAPSFTPMSLELDRERHKLYTVSMSSDEAAVIDTRTGKVDKVFAVAGAKSASGVAFDPKTNRLLVASQGSDNLVIVDAATSQVLHDVKVGAGSLNVAVDHARGLAYVPNRAAGTVTVVSLDGNIVANLPGGTFPTHVTEDGKGTIYAINKSRGAEDPDGDRITRITPR